MKSLEVDCVGYTIAADWHDGDNDEVLLVLSGYMSSKARYVDLVGALVEKTGTNALVIDYTGHGESPFEIDELRPAQNFLEVITAYDWLKKNHPELTINVMGTSYGGYLAAHLIAYRKVNKLVLRVPAIYPPGIFYDKWNDISRSDSREYRHSKEKISTHPLIKSLSEFNGRSFVVVHELDDVCPGPTTSSFTEELSAESWVAPGFGHSFRDSEVGGRAINEYQQKIADWLTNKEQTV